MKIAILVDGGFYRKRMTKVKGNIWVLYRKKRVKNRRKNNHFKHFSFLRFLVLFKVFGQILDKFWTKNTRKIGCGCKIKKVPRKEVLIV